MGASTAHERPLPFTLVLSCYREMNFAQVLGSVMTWKAIKKTATQVFRSHATLCSGSLRKILQWSYPAWVAYASTRRYPRFVITGRCSMTLARNRFARVRACALFGLVLISGLLLIGLANCGGT